MFGGGLEEGALVLRAGREEGVHWTAGKALFGKELVRFFLKGGLGKPAEVGRLGSGEKGAWGGVKSFGEVESLVIANNEGGRRPDIEGFEQYDQAVVGQSSLR
jgi:hypothetical protein